MVLRYAALPALLLGSLLLAGCGRPPAAEEGDLLDQTSKSPATTDRVAQAGTKRPPISNQPIGSGVVNFKQPAKPAPTTDKPASEKKHDPLFVNWPDPDFVLVLTGQQQGYMEPCGCTGLANQKGGLARKYTLVRETLLKEKRWPVVALDVGNQVSRHNRQQEIKFEHTIKGLQKIGYHAIAFGPDDLQLRPGYVLSAPEIADNKDTPFVCANVALFDRTNTPTFRVITSGKKTIGVTSILGDEERKKLQGDDIIHSPALDALKKVWPKLAEAKCDLYVLLSHASIEESAAIAKKFPNFDVVVTAGGAGEPTFQPEKIANTKSVMVQVGTKGMYASVMGFYPNTNTVGPKHLLRYQRVPIDDRFADAPEMIKLLGAYQEILKDEKFSGLELKPLPHPSGREFVGSNTCADCHTKAFAIWEKTGHAHATDSLVHPKERGTIQRHYDPECLSCHVTGWNPQEFKPFRTGYESLEKSKLLLGSGCENCHGPGSAHVAAENGEAKYAALRDKLRVSMRLPLAEAERRCNECHDHDNSPDFHKDGAFEKYWEQVKHKGKD